MESIQPLLFWLITFFTAMCAIAVVVTQNIVRAATWLLFTLAGTSGIFFLLGADLVGAIQLLVYVGGTLVLVVFGVMLTAQGPFITMKTSSAEWAISAVVGLLLLAVLIVGTGAAEKNLGPPPKSVLAKFAPKKPLSDDPANSPYSSVIGQGLLGVGVGPAHVEFVGEEVKVVRAHYLLPFEIVSVHLLVVLIGAAYLARAKRRRSAEA
ncbi:MAG: NADH-quinone oxidoreductase subunit J [Gemmataceae bacterium]|nr:NADH-quinone oxidoreductase subunit J [Gemmataceae bacterium]